MESSHWKTFNEYHQKASERAMGAGKRRWRAVVAVIVGISLFAALIVFAGVAVNKWEEEADPGVVACQGMADNLNSGDTKDDVSTPMTEASYIKAKKIWQHSKYAELRVVGVNVVTTIFQLDVASSKSTDDTDVGEVMRLLRTLRDQWVALQNVCAQHRVDIPALPME